MAINPNIEEEFERKDTVDGKVYQYMQFRVTLKATGQSYIVRVYEHDPANALELAKKGYNLEVYDIRPVISQQFVTHTNIPPPPTAEGNPFRAMLLQQ